MFLFYDLGREKSPCLVYKQWRWYTLLKWLGFLVMCRAAVSVRYIYIMPSSHPHSTHLKIICWRKLLRPQQWSIMSYIVRSSWSLHFSLLWAKSVSPKMKTTYGIYDKGTVICTLHIPYKKTFVFHFVGRILHTETDNRWLWIIFNPNDSFRRRTTFSL